MDEEKTMAAWWVPAAAICATILCIIVAVWRPIRSRIRENQLARARRDFHRQRERLEAKFLSLASRSGKPRGLDWVRCDFEDAVIYTRHKQSGELSAFVGVTIGFEAVAGGGMEEVEAVGNLRAATAVFRVEGGSWATDGRAIFNLTPAEAVNFYQENLELVAQELAHNNG
jgi:hypothetical protein